MKSKATGFTLGTLFILFGAYLLLQDFFYFRVEDEMIGALIFGIGSLFFYAHWIKDNRRFWGLIFGSICLFIAYVFAVQYYFWYGEDSIGVAVFVIAGATFLAAYLRNRSEWGLIIPAGACFSLAMVVYSEVYNINTSDADGGFYLFLGMSITFGILALMNNSKRNLSWAKYPALGTLALAILIGFSERVWYFEDFFLPGLLIAVGIALLLRSALFKKDDNNNQLQVQ